MRSNRTSTRPSRQPEILLRVGDGGAPMHVQVEQALREAMRCGRLRLGASLPSSRALARDLGVSRGVVVEAYDQLIAEGYLATRRGSRTFVAAAARVAPDRVPARPREAARFDFRPGLPDLALFPRREWSRATRRVLRQLAADQLTYGDPIGSPVLRAALADYLGRVRHVFASPSEIIVCSGFTQALGVTAQVLARRGAKRVAMEDPGHPDMRRIVRAAGLEPIGVRVDERGLRVDRLTRTDADAVLVTPAHQSPTGVVLAPERRQELIAWAGRRSAFIIEDDYDSEYRYDRVPVGALQGLAPDQVVYAGSASKILAPGLRLGWLVVPPALRETAAEIKRFADLGSPTLSQLVYADFLRSGELDRHLRRMRATYRRRRDALLAALARHLPAWQAEGAAAGLHLVARLPNGFEECEVVGAATSRSIRVYPMSEYRFRTSAADAPRVVMGYAGMTEARIREAIKRLGEALGARRRHRD